MPDSSPALPLDGEREGSAGLAIAAATVSSESPFWHRRDPVVAVTRMDSEHGQLREIFPESWSRLLEVKALLDAVTSLETAPSAAAGTDDALASRLLLAAADQLTQFSLTEEGGQHREVALQALTAADRLRVYARERRWPGTVLTQPCPSGPWLYCGPLGTWSFRRRSAAISLMVVSPRPDLQGGPDVIDTGLTAVQAAVAGALGGPVRFTKADRPVMQIMDLLIAGGELAYGHKHFAHFFPLESPAASVDGPEFTIVFGNIHERRLRRCSLALLDAYRGEHEPRPWPDIAMASLTWFRGHDLAHFWRRRDTRADEPASSTLTHAERMTLEEGYADVLGLISAAALCPADVLAPAFTAEMLRYLSRDQTRFSDSTAAALTIGWLLDAGVTQLPGSGAWLTAALPELRRLSQAMHQVRWEGQLTELPRLRAALATGQQFCGGLSALFQSVPSDLEFSFG